MQRFSSGDRVCGCLFGVAQRMVFSARQRAALRQPSAADNVAFRAAAARRWQLRLGHWRVCALSSRAGGTALVSRIAR